jgi:hypothetical protein
MPTWDDYLALANDEIALAAQSSPAVLRRLEQLLAGLMDIVPIERRSAVAGRLAWSRATVSGQTPVLAESAPIDSA